MLKKHKNKIISALAIIIILTAAFIWGGNSPSLHGSESEKKITLTESPTPVHTAEATQTPLPSEAPVQTEAATLPPTVPAVSAAPIISNTSQPTDVLTAPTVTPIPTAVPQTPAPAVTQEPQADAQKYCTLSVSCKQLLLNPEVIPDGKKDIIPENGIILPPTKAVLHDGDSIFNLLQRELKKARIHLEFTYTPIYESAYIEGIHNLYEFDCGELSGWMYSVNGVFPKEGCSLYKPSDGDIIEWIYTLERGKDIGDKVN